MQTAASSNALTFATCQNSCQTAQNTTKNTSQAVALNAKVFTTSSKELCAALSVVQCQAPVSSWSTLLPTSEPWSHFWDVYIAERPSCLPWPSSWLPHPWLASWKFLGPTASNPQTLISLFTHSSWHIFPEGQIRTVLGASLQQFCSSSRYISSNLCWCNLDQTVRGHSCNHEHWANTPMHTCNPIRYSLRQARQATSGTCDLTDFCSPSWWHQEVKQAFTRQGGSICKSTT